jgi:hypothetical protein
MTVSHLESVDDYTDDVATVYNAAYGYEMGIASLEGVFEDGCIVTSSANLGRRASMKLSFEAVISAALHEIATSNAATLSASSLAGSISQASAAQDASVPVPTESDISGVSYTQIVQSTDGGHDTTAITIIAILGAVVVVAAVSGLAVWHIKGRQGAAEPDKDKVEKSKDVSIEQAVGVQGVEVESPRSPGETAEKEKGKASDLDSKQSNLIEGEALPSMDTQDLNLEFSTHTNSKAGDPLDPATKGTQGAGYKSNWRDGRKTLCPTG